MSQNVELVRSLGAAHVVDHTADDFTERSGQDRSELIAATKLIEDGKLTPVLGRTYPLADTAEALRHVERGHARGKLVITVA